MHELVRRLSQLNTAPKVADVAEALGVSEAQVAGILAEIRAKPTVPTQQVQTVVTDSEVQRRFNLRWWMFLLPFVVTLIAFQLIAMITRPPALPQPALAEPPTPVPVMAAPDSGVSRDSTKR